MPESPFANWYIPGGSGSGPGSGEEYTRAYRKFIEKFLQDHHIRTVLDYGCGDWQFSKLINWGDVNYYGIDDVFELIDRLQKEHSTATRKFVHSLDGVLPVDLVIIKDVVQHLPNAEILQIAKSLKECKYLLWVNDIHENATNQDCHRGGYRHLNLKAAPFNLPLEVVFRFEDTRWPKAACLQTNVKDQHEA